MGTATDAFLYYGFDWFSEDDPGDYTQEDIERFDELYTRNLSDTNPKVSIGYHCSGEFPVYFICAYILKASRGSPSDVDISVFNDETEAKMRQEILEFCSANQIQMQEPKWILASYWG